MRIIFALVLFIGIGLAGTASYMAVQQFNRYEAELANTRRDSAPQIELTEVAVATDYLKFGQYLAASDVEMVVWPAESVPPGSFTSLEEVLGPEGSEARAVLRIIETGEPLLASKLTDFGEDAGVRSRLSPGMRAFTIRVDVSTGVSGFLQPNDSVDIYWTGSTGVRTITRLILEAVRLIAIDQIADEDATRTIVARTVTVEVTPQVVAELTQAQQTGQLTLSLRGAEDESVIGIIEVDTSDIIGQEEVIVEQQTPDRVCTTRIRKGAEVIDVEIPCPDE